MKDMLYILKLNKIRKKYVHYASKSSNWELGSLIFWEVYMILKIEKK